MATATKTRQRRTTRRKARRTSRLPGWVGPVLLWLALLRAVLGIVAIPLAPVLYRKHFMVLVLLRPTKEVLLAGGFLAREHHVSLLVLLLASVPLLLSGVWHFWALGRIYGDDLLDGKSLPRFARRLLPDKQLNAMCKVLTKRGTPVVFVGRLAMFPSTVIAAAAGVSDLPPRRFLAADAAGGLLSFVEAVGAGWVLGEAYHDAGPWLTWVGVAALAVVTFLVGRWLRRV